MNEKTFLIFDAGGVLVFPDYDLMAEIANHAGILTTSSEIARQHAVLFRNFDEYIAQNHQIPDIQYFFDIFKQVTDSIPKAKAAYERTLQEDQDNHIWATTQPWVASTLHMLKTQGYQMAVVSNSEGRVDQILRDLGLREFFEIVVDSHYEGVEKPDTRIFEIALQRLNLDPKEAIYIGDIFYIDVWGANQAGLGAIHLDRMKLYDDWDGIHVPSIQEIPDLLSKMDGNFKDWDLFPAKDFRLR